MPSIGNNDNVNILKKWMAYRRDFVLNLTCFTTCPIIDN